MIITQEALAKSFRGYDEAMSTFKQSQEIRQSYILKAKEAGDMILDAQRIFGEAGHNTRNPLVINDRSYTSFEKVLKEFPYVYEALVGEIDPDLKEEYFTYSHISKCKSLANRWHLASYLPDLLTYKHTYRLSKTLDIFKWVEDKLKENPDLEPGSLSCEQYWEEYRALRELRRQQREAEQAASPTYQALASEVRDLKDRLEAQDEQLVHYKELAEQVPELTKQLAFEKHQKKLASEEAQDHYAELTKLQEEVVKLKEKLRKHTEQRRAASPLLAQIHPAFT